MTSGQKQERQHGLRILPSDRAFLSLLVVWFALNVADAVTTWISLSRGGREGAVLYAVLFAQYPFLVSQLVKLAAVMLVVLCVCWQYRWWRLAAYLELSVVTAGMAYVVGHNLWVLHHM